MRVLIVNAESMAAEILDFVLSRAGHDVALVRRGVDGIHAATTHETAAVIVGTKLPDMAGYQFCKELRAQRYNGPVIFVSRESAVEEKIRAFDHGADDYILEPYDPLELVARVDAIARRCKQADYQALGTVLKVGEVELSVGDLTVRVGNGEPVYLTPTEMRILECLMRNPRITISRETLIERGWGYDFEGESNRLDVYILRLRKKIEQDPASPEYLHTIRGIGYVFRLPTTQAQTDAMVRSA